MGNFEPIVNIIIVTWNAVDYTKACIESIRKYTSYPYLLTVVDNGSTDGTLEYLRSEHEVNLIANKENLGYGQAIVQGYEFRPTPLICVMNNDVVVSPGWLESLVSIAKKDPEIGILGPLRPAGFCLHPYSGRSTHVVLKETRGREIPPPEEWLRRFCAPYTYEAFVREVKRRNNFGIRFLEGPPGAISTCCALINSKIAEKVGGLADPQFYKYGCEDIDLCWRIFRGGFKMAITSEAYVHHFKHVSADINELDRKSLTEENMRRFFEKWEGVIRDFLTKELQEGRDIKALLKSEEWDWWFMIELSRVIDPEKFWRGVEKSMLNKEREWQ